MADHRAVGGTGEPAVGNQGYGIAQALADEGAGDGQHFPHTRAAFGAFVANDYDVAGADFAPLDGLEGRLFLLKDPRRAFVHPLLVSGDFDNRAVRRQVAPQDGQAAGGAAGVVGGVDDGLVVGDGGGVDVRGEGFAVDRDGVAAQQAGVQQALADEGHAAVAAEVGHYIASAGFHIGDVGGVAADAVKVLQGQVNFGFPRNGHQVENGVGGAAHSDDDGDGVFEGLAGENIAGADAFLQHPHHGLAGAAGFGVFVGVDGGQGGVAGQGQPHYFDGGGHSVGGEEAGAGAFAGAGAAFQFGQLFPRHPAGGVGAHGFEYILDADVAAFEATGQDAAAIDEDAGDVEAGNGHHTAGHIFVAAGYCDQAVHPLAESYGFDGIGDNFPADQGRFHALGAHGDAVADGDGAKLEGGSFALADAVLDGGGNAVQVDVAWGDVAGQVGHGDERLFQVVGGEAHSH